MGAVNDSRKTSDLHKSSLFVINLACSGGEINKPSYDMICAVSARTLSGLHASENIQRILSISDSEVKCALHYETVAVFPSTYFYVHFEVGYCIRKGLMLTAKFEKLPQFCKKRCIRSLELFFCFA